MGRGGRVECDMSEKALCDDHAKCEWWGGRGRMGRGGGVHGIACVILCHRLCLLLETVWCSYLSVVTRSLDDPYLLNEKQKFQPFCCSLFPMTSFFAKIDFWPKTVDYSP